MTREEKTLEFRVLKEDELPSVVKTIIAGCPDVPYFAEKNPDFFASHWRDLMMTGATREFAAFFNEMPIGLMLGIIAPDWLTGLNQAHEAIWQVLPEYRNTGAGIELLKLFEQQAKLAGCARIIFGASTEQNFEPMQRLYRKLGYTPFSMTMEKRI